MLFVSLYSVIEAELCAASALIAMGAVHGKTNPVQLLLMALLEVTGFVLNQWILRTLLRVGEVFPSQIKIITEIPTILFSPQHTVPKTKLLPKCYPDRIALNIFIFIQSQQVWISTQAKAELKFERKNTI